MSSREADEEARDSHVRPAAGLASREKERKRGGRLSEGEREIGEIGERAKEK